MFCTCMGWCVVLFVVRSLDVGDVLDVSSSCLPLTVYPTGCAIVRGVSYLLLVGVSCAVYGRRSPTAFVVVAINCDAMAAERTGESF